LGVNIAGVGGTWLGCALADPTPVQGSRMHVYSLVVVMLGGGDGWGIRWVVARAGGCHHGCEHAADVGDIGF
jgi:hypothetical protein